MMKNCEGIGNLEARSRSGKSINLQQYTNWNKKRYITYSEVSADGHYMQEN